MKTADLLASSSPLPEDIWINRLVLTRNSATVASTSSDNMLRTFDPTTLQLVARIDSLHDGVTCLKPLDADPACVLTAGRDAMVRCWDVRTGKAALELGIGTKTPYISLDARGSNSIAVGTELENAQAAVLVWDSRSTGSPIRQYVESHSDDVTEISFHPNVPTCLLSGSTDGLVNIYDTSVADEDDALVQVMNHDSSISHAGFLTTTDVFALSHDEQFSVYKLETDPASDASEEPAAMFGDLRPRLNCDYVVDVTTSIGFSEGEAIIGAGSNRTAGSQHLDLCPLRSTLEWSFEEENSTRLPGAHGGDVIRAMCFNGATGNIYTGGEDGLVKVWRISENVPKASRQEEDEAKPSKRGNRSKGSRFKPY